MAYSVDFYYVGPFQRGKVLRLASKNFLVCARKLFLAVKQQRKFFLFLFSFSYKYIASWTLFVVMHNYIFNNPSSRKTIQIFKKSEG